MKPEDLKLIVREKYTEKAGLTKAENKACCCREKNTAEMDYTIFSEDYTKLDGYVPEADLGLGCGIPTEYAGIEKGHHVLDLGSGAGNDCFVARSIVGPEGKVTGLDFTEAMIAKANENLVKTGFKNVWFVQGDIEEMPVEDNSMDVVISNCVLNLVPDKKKAFSEIFRVLKPGGHFCVSDVVLEGKLPESLLEAAELYAGCVAGAVQKQEYLDIVSETGFEGAIVHKQVATTIPEEILSKYLSKDDLHDTGLSRTGIFNVTVSARKPS